MDLSTRPACPPVQWDAAAGGWRVSGHAEAEAVLRDSETFTVDDPRFSTARLTGSSMLTVDGPEHARHRAAFAAQLRPAAVRQNLSEFVAAEAQRLVGGRREPASIEVRTELAQPLAISALTRVLGLQSISPSVLARWYEELSAGFEDDARVGPLPQVPVLVELTEAVTSLAASSGLSPQEYAANVAIMLLGGIETVEGMICSAVLVRYAPSESSPSPGVAGTERADDLDRVIEESLRLLPAAVRLDRYARRDVELGGSQIAAGELVVVDVAAANRDEAVFDHGDIALAGRSNLARHLAFARGPHYCLGVHLARLEARAALLALDKALPGARLDSDRSAELVGSIFRKPDRLTLTTR